MAPSKDSGTSHAASKFYDVGGNMEFTITKISSPNRSICRRFNVDSERLGQNGLGKDSLL